MYSNVYKGIHLTFEEQINLFEERGMKFKDGKDKAIEKIKFINYYKIKEFSLPYMNENKLYKENVYFEDIIHRFYWDKNLRLYFLRITEKIEISLKTSIAYILGREFGAFGYLDFKKWTDKNRYCRYYISHKENEFKRKFALLSYETGSKIISEYKKEYPKELPIWLIIDLFSLGDIIDLYTLLNQKFRKEIAKLHGLELEQFESWIKNIRLARNLSAHNHNIVDIEFTTKPKIQIQEMKEKLHIYDIKSNTTTNKIALTVVIMEYLVFKINADFPGGAIKKALKQLCKYKTDEEAQKLGFKNFQIIEKLKI